MTATITLPADTQMLITREFDAPPHLVYKAWTTSDLVMQWWSGRRGRMELAEIDLRVGGRWRYVMTATEGFEVAFHGEYLEIVPDEKLVNTEIYEGAPESGAAVVTCTFEEHAGRTTLSMLTKVDTQEIRDTIIATGMEGGAQEGLDILEQIAIELDEAR